MSFPTMDSFDIRFQYLPICPTNSLILSFSMRFSPLLFVILFSLSINEKTFCASSEWLERIHEEARENERLFWTNNNILVDGTDINLLTDPERPLSYYLENNIKGDWSKRQLRMAINAREYDLNEPIYVRFFLKNTSDDDQLYNMTTAQFGSRLTLLIFYEDDIPIEKIQGGPTLFPSQNFWFMAYMECYNLLRPGREMQICCLQNSTLEELYPLTRPGKYRVTVSYEETQALPIEFVIRDKQYEPPLEPVQVQIIGGREYRHPENPNPIERKDLWKYAKDQWGNDFFYNTKFRLAFDPSKDQHCFNPDEPIDLLLYTIDHDLWWRGPPPIKSMPLFALDRIPYRGVRFVLFTPEGRRISKVLSSPGDAPDTFAELDDGILDLRKVFDLSTPGKYRLSGELRSMRPGQQFVPPLESNEIEFEIEGDF